MLSESENPYFKGIIIKNNYTIIFIIITIIIVIIAIIIRHNVN